MAALAIVPADRLCPRCNETKPIGDFHSRKSGSRAGQAVAHCKACNIVTRKASALRDPSRYRRVEWPSKLKSLYGITVEQYYGMLKVQGGGCAICGSLDPRSRKYSKVTHPMFYVDHCHRTGQVRGLLCLKCNAALGMIGDDPAHAMKLAEYLRTGGSFGK